MLDVRRLLVLRVVARHGSMTAAAAPLGYTPAAVSAHIAALERQAGTALLERHRRGVRLTDAGALLVEHAAVVAERVERAEADLRGLLDVRTGRLRVVAFPTAAATLLPEALGALHRDHPDVEISMEIRDNAACPALVRDGTYDVGVVYDGYPGQEIELGDLAVSSLCDDELTVALPTGHPRAGQASVALDELADEAWIRETGPDPSCRDLLDRLSTGAGFRPRVAFDGTDYAAVARLVEVGMGVALVPGLAADRVSDRVGLLPLRPSIARRIAVVTPARPSPAATAMVGALRTRARFRGP